MSDIEDRLRAELWAQAQRTQDEDLRELRMPSPQAPARRPRRGRGRARYWLAPLAAALAVIGVIVGVQLSVPGPAAVPAAPPVPHGQPRYYLEIPDAGGDIDEPSITVRRTADAAAVAQVSVPGVILGEAATVNDRTFILAGWRKPAGTKPDFFYRLTLSDRGHVRRLQKLSLKGFQVPAGPHGYSVGSMALAPDGQTLAFAVNPSGEEADVVTGRAAIRVVSLRTGAVRTWTAPSTNFLVDLSWGRGTQTLQFLIIDRGPYKNTLRRLNLSKPGASLLAASPPVPIPASAGLVTSALAVDNGRVVLAITNKPADAAHHPADSVLSEFSARTGRRLRVLMTFRSGDRFAGNGMVWSADPSGQHVIIGGTEVTGLQKIRRTIALPGGGTQVLREEEPVTRRLFGRLDNGRYTALPDRPAPGRPGRQDQAGVW